MTMGLDKYSQFTIYHALWIEDLDFSIQDKEKLSASIVINVSRIFSK